MNNVNNNTNNKKLFIYKNEITNEIIGYNNNFNKKCIEISLEDWIKYESGKYIDIDTKNNKVIFLEKPQATHAIEQRILSYPAITDQLDSIFHDIDNGLFGAEAKSSSFYKAIREIKEKYPKTVETIEETEQLKKLILKQPLGSNREWIKK